MLNYIYDLLKELLRPAGIFGQGIIVEIYGSDCENELN